MTKFLAGAAVALLLVWADNAWINSRTAHPVLTRTSDGGYTLEHVAYPECPNDYERVVDIPERDEVDALTITCSKTLVETTEK